jgi:hypothetical protein
MAEHDCTWAHLIDMARRAYSDDPKLVAIHSYGCQADQLETDAMRLRVTPAIVGRTTASMYDRRSLRLTRITIYVKMVVLANQ